MIAIVQFNHRAALDAVAAPWLHSRSHPPGSSEHGRWAAILMNKKRLNCALEISIAISLTLALVSCSRHTAGPAWIADADRVVVQGGNPLVEGHLGDPLILTISGQKANELKQVVASAEPIPGPVGIKLLYEAKVYHGTNYLGQIYSYGDLFSVENHNYQAKKGALASLIDTPIHALAEAQRSRPNSQGGANGRQSFGPETNPTSGAAASRRSP